MSNHLSFNSNNQEFIVTIDNAVGIGQKEYDHIQVPYDILSYFTLRTAYIDNITSYGKPNCIILANGCGDESHKSLMKGIDRFKTETNINIPVISSSESNFKILQSSLSVTVIGEKKLPNKKAEFRDSKYAVIGKPLVGNEVIEDIHSVVNIDLIAKLLKLPSVLNVIPIGSKGIQATFNKNFGNKKINCFLDVYKSAGPSTAVIIEYLDEVEVKDLVLNNFYEILED